MALDAENSELAGIGIDSYQFYHYKTVFGNEYLIQQRASVPVSIGAVISGPGVPTNYTYLVKGPDHYHSKSEHIINPIIKCLSRHVLFGKSSLDRNLGASLYHPKELQKKGLIAERTSQIFDNTIKGFVGGWLLILAILLIIGNIFGQLFSRIRSCKVRWDNIQH